MTQFDELPKVSTIDALNFWLEKQKEYKSSADFLLFGEHEQRQKYLDIIPFVKAAIDALEIKRDNDSSPDGNILLGYIKDNFENKIETFTPTASGSSLNEWRNDEYNDGEDFEDDEPEQNSLAESCHCGAYKFSKNRWLHVSDCIC